MDDDFVRVREREILAPRAEREVRVHVPKRVDVGLAGLRRRKHDEILAGIEHCPNIKGLDLTSMIGTVDLRDLLPPFKVETISAGVALSNIPALLDMPSLRSVRILDDQLYEEVTTPGHPNRQVMEVLKARGVSVWVHWVSSYDENRPAYQ